ncbi:MAG TPA: hypothetical protein VFW90_02155 [Candidatus Saccharimonadales bacterium]|nr:hypothetical protein [Candidatus Saccharimonadales bacterium]
MESPEENIKLRYSVPIVTIDGNVVAISDQGAPTLLFFQAREQHGDHTHADVVAAVRLSNIDDLENLNKAIKDTINRHKNREP